MKNKAISLGIFALGVLLLGGLNVVNADTDIWTNLQTTGGQTYYAENTNIGGEDWSEGAMTTNPTDYHYPPTPKYTANIFEQIENSGSIQMQKALTSNAPWELEEKKIVSGTGDTKLFSDVLLWTEDKKIDPATGKLVYPTEGWVTTEFTTPKPLYDAESWHVIMDTPDAVDDIVPTANPQYGWFNKVIDTNEDFNFIFKTGINNFPCDYEIPEMPQPTSMHWIE